MKIKTIKFCSLFLYVLLIFQLVSAFPISFSNKNETLIVKDSDAITGLPNRFRDLTNLNISGSAQFTPSQIENIKNSINKPDICIVDLRQESHGFINDLAISFYSIGKDLNNGFTTEETISTEDKLLNSIKQNSQINIYDKLGKVLTNITVDSVSTENNAINKNDIETVLKTLGIIDLTNEGKKVVENSWNNFISSLRGNLKDEVRDEMLTNIFEASGATLNSFASFVNTATAIAKEPESASSFVVLNPNVADTTGVLAQYGSTLGKVATGCKIGLPILGGILDFASMRKEGTNLQDAAVKDLCKCNLTRKFKEKMIKVMEI